MKWFLSPYRRRTVLSLSLLAAVLAPVAGEAAGTPSASRQLAGAPLSFEPNLGQTAPEVRYLARGAGYTLFLTRDEAVLALSAEPAGRKGAASVAPRRSVLRMRPLNAAPASSLETEGRVVGRSNYLHLSEPGKTLAAVPRYERVRARGIYPGIDMVYHRLDGSARGLEYDFVVAPGADPSRIRLGFEGAESLGIDTAGNLHLRLAQGELVQPAPVLYQEIAGQRRPVAGRFALHGEEVAFETGAYDAARPLVIDPQLVWASLLGGSGFEFVNDVAVTPNGQVYATGYTSSADFPTRPAQSGPAAGYDAFVTKFNLDGSGIDWSTYLSGAGGAYQDGAGIALDANRNSYIVGSTDELHPGGATDIFVAKLNAAGSGLALLPHLRRQRQRLRHPIALDAALNAYVVGTTHSTDFPVQSAAQSILNGQSDTIVVKLNAAGSTVYSTYHGGANSESGQAIAVDASGRAIVTGSYLVNGGSTFSYQAFAARLTAAGSGLQGQFTFGGADNESAAGLAIDNSGNVWVAGDTRSTDFWTSTDAFRRTLNGVSDAFLARINAAWTGFSYATYLGDAKISTSPG